MHERYQNCAQLLLPKTWGAVIMPRDSGVIVSKRESVYTECRSLFLQSAREWIPQDLLVSNNVPVKTLHVFAATLFALFTYVAC